MGRLKELRKYVEHELNKMEDIDRQNSAIAHETALARIFMASLLLRQ